MKRIMMFVLIMLLFASFSLADSDDGFHGTWIQYKETSTGISCTVLHFSTDGLVYYSDMTLNSDDEGGEKAWTRHHVGEWHETASGVHAQTGFNSSMDCEIIETGVLGVKLTGGYVPFYRVPDPQAENASTASSGSGTSVEQGRYLVGTDIPAGVYRLESIDNRSADVYVYKDKDAALHSAYILISKNQPSYARLELTEGQVLRIDMGPVLFTEPTSLNFDWVNQND